MQSLGTMIARAVGGVIAGFLLLAAGPVQPCTKLDCLLFNDPSSRQRHSLRFQSP